jgi:hypothetical protein
LKKQGYEIRSKVNIIQPNADKYNNFNLSFSVSEKYSEDIGISNVDDDSKYFEVEEASPEKIVLSIHDKKMKKSDQ